MERKKKEVTSICYFAANNLMTANETLKSKRTNAVISSDLESYTPDN